MIYVYCGRASKSAVRLTTYLKENGPGAKKTTEFTMEPGDLAINWGVPLGFSVRGLWLNARFVGDKRLDLAKMRHAGLPRCQPAPAQASSGGPRCTTMATIWTKEATTTTLKRWLRLGSAGSIPSRGSVSEQD